MSRISRTSNSKVSPRLNPSGGGGRLYGALPSVTTVLEVLDDKAWMNSWRNKVGHKEANRVMNEAQTLGTRVHSLARKICHGEYALALHDPLVPEDVVAYAQPIREFLDKHVSEVLATELELVSPKLGYGGTLDLYVRLHGGATAVVDWKTTGSTERKMGVQLAAYALLLRDHGYPVNRRAIVHIRKDDKRRGTYKVRWYEDHLGDVKCWKGALEVWRWKNANMLKKLGEAAG